MDIIVIQKSSFFILFYFICFVKQKYTTKIPSHVYYSYITNWFRFNKKKVHTSNSFPLKKTLEISLVLHLLCVCLCCDWLAHVLWRLGLYKRRVVGGDCIEIAKICLVTDSFSLALDLYYAPAPCVKGSQPFLQHAWKGMNMLTGNCRRYCYF